MWGYLHAIKHANGKDWWIVDLKMTILGGSKTNEHQIIKLDQNGVQKVKSQNFGPSFLTTILQQVVLLNFLPDGQKWVYYCPWMDYGSLTLIGRKEEFSQLQISNIRHKLHSATGLEWSPNNRFLYISSSDSCFNTIPGFGRLGRFWKIGRYLGRIK